jgi:hypothetical protein
MLEELRNPVDIKEKDQAQAPAGRKSNHPIHSAVGVPVSRFNPCGGTEAE